MQQAIAMFNKNNDEGHEQYNIEVEDDGNIWIVYFDGKSQIPGDHATVTINKETGETLYYPGE